jgi:flavin reductase (DIM6/NTAB) family NADH-FMN oxidoreductase RutF
MTRKKIWNRVNLPVYSVSSVSPDGVPNMNICTYASAVSMQPKRFMVAIYEGTKTLENVKKSNRMLLQVLSVKNLHRVRRLGFSSGNEKEKLQGMDDELVEFQDGFLYLNECVGFMELEVIEWTRAGDHVMALCDVKSSKNVTENEPMTLDDLREKGIVRI